MNIGKWQIQFWLISRYKCSEDCGPHWHLCEWRIKNWRKDFLKDFPESAICQVYKVWFQFGPISITKF